MPAKAERWPTASGHCSAGNFWRHEHIRDICRRLALEGYLAIALNFTSAKAIRMILPISPRC